MSRYTLAFSPYERGQPLDPTEFQTHRGKWEYCLMGQWGSLTRCGYELSLVQCLARSTPPLQMLASVNSYSCSHCPHPTPTNTYFNIWWVLRNKSTDRKDREQKKGVRDKEHEDTNLHAEYCVSSKDNVTVPFYWYKVHHALKPMPGADTKYNRYYS